MFALRLVIFALNDVNAAADTAKTVLLTEGVADNLTIGFAGNEILLAGPVGNVLSAAAALEAAGMLDSPVSRAWKRRKAELLTAM